MNAAFSFLSSWRRFAVFRWVDSDSSKVSEFRKGHLPQRKKLSFRKFDLEELFLRMKGFATGLKQEGNSYFSSPVLHFRLRFDQFADAQGVKDRLNRNGKLLLLASWDSKWADVY